MDNSALIDLVLGFAREMNDLQLQYYPMLDRAEDTQAVHQSYRAKADEIYGRYLTPRKRSCYYAISSPPHFLGVNDTALKTVDREEKRATVTVYTREGLLDFQFNLVCRKGDWLINSYKQRYRSQEWELVYQWLYGNF